MYTNKDFDQQTDYCGAVLTCDYCKTEYKLVENDSISPIQICKHQTFCMDCINDVNTRVIGDMERSYCIYCILDGETYDLWPDDDYGAWTSADIIELGVQDVLKNGQEYTQYKTHNTGRNTIRTVIAEVSVHNLRRCTRVESQWQIK